ncbi:hypothetical protein DFH07DRAFT_779647 [Mycena maculata]|uniref:Yeast cell wall synthesis Kre9/Knh1-like N-terminal domain-containing protein n=1 Tax=Mycena maculata TaxID=230809 RepID=A0AAD7MWX7_9AGAR|nr:hypothetical protein DFH07DRAFT_779647 [Mycena maculata]
MKFAVSNIFAFLSAAALAAVQATPLISSRDVYAPPITYPHTDSVWLVGQTHTVTWNATNPPAQITNPIGTILLRKSNLTTPVIMQANFALVSGKATVKVPWVQDGDDYQLVLFGDSGNFSPYFTIKYRNS